MFFVFVSIECIGSSLSLGLQAPAASYSVPSTNYGTPQVSYSAPAASAVSYAAPAQTYSQAAPAPAYSHPAPAPVYSQPAPVYSQPAPIQQSALVQKHIYVHVPPPDHEEIHATRNAQAVQPQKHYKIIFIKAPSAPSYRTQILQQQQLNEEKTLVYVLVKKPEGPEDIHLPEIAPTTPSKPEVYFIKYKTQKEQHAVQPTIIQNA